MTKKELDQRLNLVLIRAGNARVDCDAGKITNHECAEIGRQCEKEAEELCKSFGKP